MVENNKKRKRKERTRAVAQALVYKLEGAEIMMFEPSAHRSRCGGLVLPSWHTINLFICKYTLVWRKIKKKEREKNILRAASRALVHKGAEITMIEPSAEENLCAKRL